MIRNLAPIAGALVLMLGPAMAQAPEGTQGGRLAACRADVEQLCKGVEAGGGRRVACLAENKAKLSPDCLKVVEERAARGPGRRGASGLGATDVAKDNGGAPADTAEPGAKPAAGPGDPGTRADRQGRGRMAACRTDIATHCADAERGPARAQCLRDNAAKLSPDCQAALAERRAEAQSLRAACKADRDALCSTVERGGGRMLQCLRDNKDKVSPACGAALSTIPERARAPGKRA